MFFLHDISNFNKKEVKVKSYIRDGHLVKQSKRKIDIKDLVNKAGIGLGIGTGIGAAYLLGNRNGFNNSKKVISELENKLLKREPKIINRIINRVPKQDRHIGVEEIRDIIRSENQSLMGEVKQEISRVNNNTSKEIIREVITPNNSSVIKDEIVKPNIKLVNEIKPITKIDKSKLNVSRLIKRVKSNALTNILLTNENNGHKINLDKLEEVFNKKFDLGGIEDALNKVHENHNDILLAMQDNSLSNSARNKLVRLSDRYTLIKDRLNKVKLNKQEEDAVRIKGLLGMDDDFLSEMIETPKTLITASEEKELQKAGVNDELQQELKDKYEIPEHIINKIKINYKKEEKDIFSTDEQQFNRWKARLEILLKAKGILKEKNYEPLPDSLLDQFNKKINTMNFSSPYFLSDININFSRNKGSKDRVKRMSRLGAYTRIGTVGLLGTLAGGSSGIITRNKKAALIGGALGGSIIGGTSLLEHLASPYSPIGKKKWKNYSTDNPKFYGIPLNKLPRLTK